MALRLLSFPDLCELRLVNNWTTLNNWINRRGFPPGRHARQAPDVDRGAGCRLD